MTKQSRKEGGRKKNKLSLIGMQLPEKYKENFDFSSEDLSSGDSSGGREIK
jgi:hypothetical protein